MLLRTHVEQTPSVITQTGITPAAVKRATDLLKEEPTAQVIFVLGYGKDAKRFSGTSAFWFSTSF